MPTFLHPSKEITPHHQYPIHSQQQTTVYVGKDVTATPENSAPQYRPQKIVIPIPSLYPGEARRVSTHPASMHEADTDDEQTKGELYIYIDKLA